MSVLLRYVYFFSAHAEIRIYIYFVLCKLYIYIYNLHKTKYIYILISACAEKKYTYLSNTDICYKIYDDIFGLLNPGDGCQSDGAHLIMLDTAEKLQDFQFLPTGSK